MALCSHFVSFQEKFHGLLETAAKFVNDSLIKILSISVEKFNSPFQHFEIYAIIDETRRHYLLVIFSEEIIFALISVPGSCLFSAIVISINNFWIKNVFAFRLLRN